MLKKFSKTFEFTILVRWLLFAEILYLIVMSLIKLDNQAFTKYQDFVDEDVHVVRVYDVQYDQNRYKPRYLLFKCKTKLSGKEYVFTVDPAEFSQELDEKSLRKMAEDRAELHGYLYSTQDRKYMFFSRSFYHEHEFLFKKYLEEIYTLSRSALLIRIICYVIFGFYAYLKLKAPSRREWKFYRNETKAHPTGDQYTNRAIKNNPEYSYQAKEIFAQNYPREIVTVAKALRSGAAKVSAQQTKALKKTGEYVPEEEEWVYGRSVMTELSTTSPADAIYRVYREGHIDEEFEEPEEKVPLERELEGPITSDYAVAREAVLLKTEPKKLFQKKRKVLLVERTREGDYALHQLEPDYFVAREIPGNYVLFIKDKDVVGVYENVLKNKDNPIMLEYDDRIKKIRSNEKHYHYVQHSWIFGSLILLVLAWRFTWTWFAPAAFGIYMIAVHSFKRFALSVAKDHEKKNGKFIFDSMFRVRWGIPYTILKVIAVILLIVRFICVGIA
ncbi:MAG: hypothetical protein J5546_08720 [Lachnospiraceae bacterium]|nr:hypothetical protein [Lachnospiraceae bacterium]